jgi:hypothetical protein
MDIVALFTDVDDFCREFEPQWQSRQLRRGSRQRQSKLCLSEVLTITIAFHQSGYRTFKDFYQKEVGKHWRNEFPSLVSYHRFVELMSAALVPLCCFLNTRRGQLTGLAFIDSTPLAICHNARILSNKVFRGLATRGKNSVGWFYGFKLHLVVNELGELLALKLTPAHVDDRVPVPDLTADLIGKLFGDRGYVSHPLFEELFDRGLQLITRLKKKMKNALMPMFDKILLRKRAIIESVNDQLKNISQIEHSRHRSPTNFMVNVIAGLIAYTYRATKPALNLRPEPVAQLPVLVA